MRGGIRRPERGSRAGVVIAPRRREGRRQQQGRRHCWLTPGSGYPSSPRQSGPTRGSRHHSGFRQAGRPPNPRGLGSIRPGRAHPEPAEAARAAADEDTGWEPQLQGGPERRGGGGGRGRDSFNHRHRMPSWPRDRFRLMPFCPARHGPRVSRCRAGTNGTEFGTGAGASFLRPGSGDTQALPRRSLNPRPGDDSLWHPARESTRLCGCARPENGRCFLAHAHVRGVAM